MKNAIEQYDASGPIFQDAVKKLRVNVDFAAAERELKTIAIVSTLHGEGKSTLCIHLGVAMAQSGKRTVLVEANCRHPMLAQLLGLHPPVKQYALLLGQASIEQAVVPTAQEKLYFLDMEPGLLNPVEVMGSVRYRKLVAQLKDQYDCILFDTAPMRAFIEPAITASQADATIFLVRAAMVESKLAQESMDQLRRARANVIGTVLNDAQEEAFAPPYPSNRQKHVRQSNARHKS